MINEAKLARAIAEEIADWAVSECHFQGMFESSVEYAMPLITAAFREAIAEERERCAEIAENYSDPNPFPTTMGAIAAAIREESKP
jgi:hypothetical protein